MRSRINSTGRQKIPASMAAFTVTPREDGTAEFQASIDLTGLGLHGDGQVIVEAYRQSLHERFPFGTVHLPGPRENPVLRELDHSSAIRFRVKVVEPGTGRLLARGDKFTTVEAEESGRHELFKVVEKDLGQELWRTEIFDEDSRPVLALNNQIPDALSRIATDLHMQAYILPAALRQVLMMLWLEKREEEDEDEGEEDESHWTTQWIRFAQKLTNEPKPDWSQTADSYAWIDQVCSVFALQFSLMDRIATEDERA